MLQIILNKLNSGNDKWLCSGISELIVGSSVAQIRDWNFHGQTFGNNPEYDYCLDDKRIEQKITGAYANPEDSDLKFRIPIEYSRINGAESGILKTKADWYVILSLGYNNEISQRVGKVRIFEVERIKNYFPKLVGTKFDKIFQTSDPDGGSKCLLIPSKDWQLYHDFVLDVAVITDGDKIIGYDFGNILKKKFK